MAINVEGALPDGVTAKDLILAIIGQIGTGGGQGYIVEYRGEAIRSLSMEGRMTICNMSIEAGARAGLVAPDETTFEYLKGRPHAPQGADWDAAVDYWKSLPTDEGAVFDAEVTIDATTLTPYVTWGTNPGQALPLGASRARAGGDQGPERHRARPHLHGPDGRHSAAGDHAWTPCSSAPAPTAGSRTCAPSPRHQRPQGRRRRAHAGRAGVDAGPRAGRGRGAQRGLHRGVAPNGAWPAARCASA